MKIQSTQDYTLFKRISGNRTLSKPHVNRLLEAIKESPDTITYNPIIVNENMEVIDGQHRLKAIESLGLPVHYIKVNDIGLVTVQRLNSLSKSWSPMDYAKSFAENGVEEYKVYIDFKSEFKLNHDILMRYLSLEKPMTGAAFKQGKFVTPSPLLSHLYCQQLIEVAEYYPRATTRNAANGFYLVCNAEGYDHKRMLRQLEKFGNLFQEQAQANDFAREFERIYNFRQRTTKRLF